MLSHFYLFGETYTQVLCPFCNWVVFSSLNLGFLYIFWVLDPYQVVLFANNLFNFLHFLDSLLVYKSLTVIIFFFFAKQALYHMSPIFPFMASFWFISKNLLPNPTMTHFYAFF
jgi:hypothetical protein